MTNNTTTKKQVPTDDEIASLFISIYPNVKFGMGDFYEYQNGFGYYKIIPKEIIDKRILDILIKNKNKGIRPNNQKLNSVYKLLEAMLYIPTEKWLYHPNLLNLQNSVLDIFKRSLIKHSPEFYFREVLPFKYDPKARLPAFWVLDQLSDEEKDFLQEYFGYCLTEHTKHEIALFIVGPPASGKTTLIEPVSKVLGDKAISLGLGDLINSKFNRHLIVGKTLAYATETPDYDINIIDVLKSMISGESILVERKFHDPYSYRPNAKFIFAMNSLPVIKKGNNGLRRRLAIIEIQHQIPDEIRNPNKKEFTEEELAGVLNWMLDGLERLEKQGKFDIPISIQIRTDEYFTSYSLTSQVKKFIVAECELGANFQVQSSKLYEEFDLWQKANKFQEISIMHFVELMKSLGFTKFKKSSQFWRGIHLKNRESRESREI